MVNIPTMSDPLAVTAQGQVWLCAGVPWDNTYEHARLYSSKESAFAGIVNAWKVWDMTGVVDIGLGKLEVKIPYQQAVGYGINYLIFRNNSNQDAEYHFCFVTGIERMSINSCLLRLEVDIFQTCIYDAVFHPCFVERTHVPKSDDVIGNYTYPEGLELGTYICRNVTHIPNDDRRKAQYICIGCTFDAEGNPAVGYTSQKVYSGIKYYVFGDADEANAFLESITDKNLLDGITSIFMIPTYYVSWGDDGLPVGDDTPHTHTHSIPKSDLDGYTPHNNKLFVYPYNFLYVSNNSGGGIEYKYEYFDDVDNVTFESYLAFSDNPQLIMYPTKYKGADRYFMDSITFDAYPKCSIATDSYKAWLAQTGSNVGLDFLSNLFGLSLGGEQKTLASTVLSQAPKLISGFSGGLISGISSVFNSLAQVTQSYIQAPGAKGVTSNVGLSGLLQNGFDLYKMQISKEYAFRIDSYFEMFGYKVCENMTPNFTSRKYWNYIKTLDINIQGKFPLDYRNKMNAIFNNGITIWHINDVGNYTVGENI